jgi:hypothetical protein
MSEPEYDPALAQHLRTRDGVLGLMHNLFGGGEAVAMSSSKITTALYKINRATRNMPAIDGPVATMRLQSAPYRCALHKAASQTDEGIGI